MLEASFLKFNTSAYEQRLSSSQCCQSAAQDAVVGYGLTRDKYLTS